MTSNNHVDTYAGKARRFAFVPVDPVSPAILRKEDMDRSRIVADGRANLLNDPENQKKIDDTIREIRTRYDQEMNARSWIARIGLWLQMRKEMRAAIEQIAPSRGCYLKK